MIQVRYHRNEQGDVTTFQVSGHADYAAHGQDIVCAAVSALVDTSLLALDRIAGQATEQENREGYSYCRLLPGNEGAWQQAQVILETMLLGLTEIAKGYKKYIRVREGGSVRHDVD